jgi:hypothetical protein
MIFNKKMRGQAAMEYLMTYGWAILVIVIVIAILAFFLPSTPESCRFDQPGFSCSSEPGDFGIIANTSQANEIYVAVNIENGKGKIIKMNSIFCTTGSLIEAAAFKDTLALPVDEDVPSGVTKQFDVPCYDNDGNVVVKSPGESFLGSLIIYYNFVPDVVKVNRTAEAKVTGTVIEG